MTQTLIALAPVLSIAIGFAGSYLTYHLSLRKTKHDELRDWADRMERENDRLRAEMKDANESIDALKAANEKLKAKLRKKGHDDD